jgi:hypothetical protein
LLFNRGNPAKWLLIGLSGIAGGMLFPVTILPDWLQMVAKLNPRTHALNAMRWFAAIASGYRAVDSSPSYCSRFPCWYFIGLSSAQKPPAPSPTVDAHISKHTGTSRRSKTKRPALVFAGLRLFFI